ncbi:hypothetical protein [Faecalibacterium prausnitzii]|uniref:hypothetical protein n=1 Tax=Faecalibacterium prausnitzii TaxID=853 RepID=UPI0011BEAF98|nr:hypothetical protein [Faecalibacterium prausnitzii]
MFTALMSSISIYLPVSVSMGGLPADGQKKELFHNGKVQNAKKGNNEPTAKTAANCFFSFARIILACIVFSPFQFAIYFDIFYHRNAKCVNASALFSCKKVCRSLPGFLATLPKIHHAPPPGRQTAKNPV